MDKQTKQQALLHRLRSLADQPQEQTRYALELLERERGIQVVSAALACVTSATPAEARPVLLRLYDYYDQIPLKRDAGGHLRSSVLTALQPIARLPDRSLAERAAMTYEFLPPKREECAGGLRIAGLALLETLDVVLASYHSVRLLNDMYTSRMSGEPAVSAVRVLANHGHFLPLYGFLLSNLLQDEVLSGLQAEQKSIPEVMGECLRSLAHTPSSVVDDLFARYLSYSPGAMMLTYETKEDMELVGFFDLLLAQPPRNTYLNFLEGFLRKTERDALYRYVITLIVASPHPELRTLVLGVARQEQDAQKVEILLSAFALIQHDPIVTGLIQELQQRQRSHTRGRYL